MSREDSDTEVGTLSVVSVPISNNSPTSSWWSELAFPVGSLTEDSKDSRR